MILCDSKLFFSHKFMASLLQTNTKSNSRKMKKTILLAAVLVITLACNNTKSTTTTEKDVPTETASNTSASIDGKWNLSKLNLEEGVGKNISELFPHQTPALNIQGTTVQGTDGCNTLNGSFEIKDGNQIQIGNQLATTMMACNGVSDFLFKQALGQTTSYRVTDTHLNFINEEGKVILEFTKGIESLDGTWTLNFIQTLDRSAKGIDMRFPMGAPEITFNGSQVNGSTGCNNFNGGVEIKDQSLTVGNLAMTRKYCEGVEEQLFVDALNNVSKHRIEDHKLILSNQDDRDLLVFVKK